MYQPDAIASYKFRDCTFIVTANEGQIRDYDGFSEEVYDITYPHRVLFIDYVNNRDFTVPAEMDDGSTNPLAGDLGPEGISFIAEDDSPIDTPLLVVGNEVSGTTTIYSSDLIEEEGEVGDNKSK
jgi:hypothetical protein